VTWRLLGLNRGGVHLDPGCEHCDEKLVDAVWIVRWSSTGWSLAMLGSTCSE
jgi:hypothetical protein